MRLSTTPLIRPLLQALALACALPALAQTAAPAAPVEAAPLPATAQAGAAKRITHEDELARIDELRAGGQTLAIEVKPKNAPAYEIVPLRGTEDSSGPGQTTGSGGKSRWRILSF